MYAQFYAQWWAEDTRFAEFESLIMISCILAAFFEENPLKTTHTLVNPANILKKFRFFLVILLLIW